MGYSRLSRRAVLKTAALGSAAAITAPYVSGAYAAGSLSLGCWDHWVPGANKALDKLCKEWGDKNKVDVHIDYITSQGEKDKLTAAAEAQAGTGHDIMSHRDWNIRIHQAVLEPLDDVIDELIKQYGPISPVAEYLAKIKGVWRGVPTAVGSQVKPCCSRFDLYKQHAGIDLRDMFPADEVEIRQGQDRQLDLGSLSRRRRRSCTRPASRSACRWARPPTRSTGSAGCSTPTAWSSSTPRTTSRSTPTRRGRRWNIARKLMEVNPPEVYAWDDAGNNRWLISGKGSGIMNPPSAWAVAKRDNPKVAEKCWTHPVPKGPKGRFVGQLPQFYGLWKFSKNKPAAKDLLLHISQKESVAQAGRSVGRLRPARRSRPCTTSTPGRPSSRRSAPSTAIRRAATSRPRSFGAPARSEVGAQMYNQAINTVMVSKFTQGNEKLDDVIKWAENELEGTLRA